MSTQPHVLIIHIPGAAVSIVGLCVCPGLSLSDYLMIIDLSSAVHPVADPRCPFVFNAI